jgi:Arc/MetJ-type ribon-helix-helix transcriptional regulator
MASKDMDRRETEPRGKYRFAMRLDPDLDADLIAWLEAQPHGRRSEAVRDLMRDGLRMREIDIELPRLVRQAIGEALSEVPIRPTQSDNIDEKNDIEEQYGDQLDSMLDSLG